MIWKRQGDFDPLFKAAAVKHGVPYALLKAIAGSESGFDPRSVLFEPSHKTTKQPGDTDASRGLMQTTEEAAKDLGWPAGKSFEDLFDPATSIDYGSREIKKYLDNPNRNVGPKSQPMVVAGGTRVANALAAYNAGFPRAIQFTTLNIASIYGYKVEDVPRLIQAGWVYANQPYVDRELAYMVYFDALDRGDTTTAARLESDIGGKAYGVLRLLCCSGLQYPCSFWWLSRGSEFGGGSGVVSDS